MPKASNPSGLNSASWPSQAEKTKDTESYFESIFMAKPIKEPQKMLNPASSPSQAENAKDAESSFESKPS